MVTILTDYLLHTRHWYWHTSQELTFW